MLIVFQENPMEAGMYLRKVTALIASFGGRSHDIGINNKEVKQEKLHPDKKSTLETKLKGKCNSNQSQQIAK